MNTPLNDSKAGKILAWLTVGLALWLTFTLFYVDILQSMEPGWVRDILTIVGVGFGGACIMSITVGVCHKMMGSNNGNRSNHRW